MLEQHSRTRILTGFEKPTLFPCYVAPEKRAGISNAARNRVLESYSNIFFPLGKDHLMKSFIRLMKEGQPSSKC